MNALAAKQDATDAVACTVRRPGRDWDRESADAVWVWFTEERIDRVAREIYRGGLDLDEVKFVIEEKLAELIRQRLPGYWPDRMKSDVLERELELSEDLSKLAAAFSRLRFLARRLGRAPLRSVIQATREVAVAKGDKKVLGLKSAMTGALNGMVEREFFYGSLGVRGDRFLRPVISELLRDPPHLHHSQMKHFYLNRWIVEQALPQVLREKCPFSTWAIHAMRKAVKSWRIQAVLRRIRAAREEDEEDLLEQIAGDDVGSVDVAKILRELDPGARLLLVALEASGLDTAFKRQLWQELQEIIGGLPSMIQADDAHMRVVRALVVEGRSAREAVESEDGIAAGTPHKWTNHFRRDVVKWVWGRMAEADRRAFREIQPHDGAAIDAAVEVNIAPPKRTMRQLFVFLARRI